MNLLHQFSLQVFYAYLKIYTGYQCHKANTFLALIQVYESIKKRNSLKTRLPSKHTLNQMTCVKILRL